MKPNIPPVLITFALVCFALVQNTQAVDPPPDGGYQNYNTAEGTDALFSLGGGGGNTAIGYQALYSDTSGSANTATGMQALNSNTTGLYNTATGWDALRFSSTGWDNTATGTSAMFHNTTGDGNTATGMQALFYNTTGYYNTATGVNALVSNTTGYYNTATGGLSLYFNSTARYNTASGYQALFSNHNGDNNTADGLNALFSNVSGSNNTATGFDALFNNSTGNGNIALGAFAGVNLTTGSNNIDIGSAGVAGESNTTRIRNIYSSVANGRAVYVNSDDKIGTLSSSRRYKEQIKPMDKASEAILWLKPVSFRYKKEIDPMRCLGFGLIAEEVAQVNADLVTCDADGKPETVRYEAVNAMLLNEFLKEHHKNEEQQATIAQLKSGMEALTATVKEQAAQIQKVSAQLEASKSAPQVVNNNQ
ncbi:MAG: tail fiber domain-containing protein [Candidatus Udaeobacter sp.]